MKALEGAGFVHLYGVSPVLNALRADHRDMRCPKDDIDMDTLSEERRVHEENQRQRKQKEQ